jgi:hypothetical protein
MDSFVVAGIVFVCTFGGAWLGMFLRRVLPDQHLGSDSKDVIKLGTGLIATMSALVLGLLVSSAKASFDAQRAGFQQISTNFILLDRALAQYGPDAKDARETLRKLVANTLERLWPADGSRPAHLDSGEITAEGTAFFAAVRELKPRDETQRAAQAQAIQIGAEMAKTRWMMTQQEDGSIPKPFLVVLVFWLAVLFTSFGLFSPRNATVVVVLLLCAVSVSAALFMIVDMDRPFEGVFQISSAPMRSALSQMGK